jgi:cytidylate kinase
MKNVIITIGRQYGCGGRTVGQLLADKLGVKYYDNRLISLTAEKSGVSKEYVADFDEKPRKFSSGLFSYGSVGAGNFYPLYDNIAINDKLFLVQSEIIREAANEACVIVGRCADFVLKDKPNLVRVFLYADIEPRKKRIIEKYGEGEDVKNLEKFIMKADKKRAAYYNSYSDGEWGAATNYDLCINTGKIPVDAVADLIIEYAEKL